MPAALWLLEVESYFGSFVFMGSPELGGYQRRENPAVWRSLTLRSWREQAAGSN